MSVRLKVDRAGDTPWQNKIGWEWSRPKRKKHANEKIWENIVSIDKGWTRVALVT